MKLKKHLFAGLALVLAAALLAGCSSGTAASEASASASGSAPEQTASQAPATAEPTQEAADSALPSTQEPEESEGFTPQAYTFPLVEEPETLSYFATISPNYSAFMEDYSTNEAVRALEELTGVHIDYQCYIPENAQTQFNLQAAGGSLPDILLGATEYYTGGMDKAVEDGILLNLADYLDDCPNYSAILDSDDLIRSSLTTHSGNLIGFYAYTDPAVATPVSGCIMVREDWLEQVDMDVPTTYDEVHDVLAAFKRELGVETPMIVTSYLDDQSGSFAAGYDIKAFFMTSPGIQVPFYVVDGQVKCAIVEDDFVSYIEMLQGYMSEGLTAKDVESYTNEMSYQDLVTSGQVGFFWGYGVNSLDVLNGSLTDGGRLVAVPAIRKTADQTLHFTSAANYQARSCVSLSANCKNVELACKWLDAHYTQEVSMLGMYGVEDVSYTYDADGEPQFTDLMLKNPDGITLDSCKALYTLGPADNVGYYYINTDLATYSEAQQEAITLINEGPMDDAYVLPTGAAMTAEEMETYTSLLADLSTYMAEHVLKFVTGEEAMEDYPAFIDQLFELGMQEALDLQQAAYDRYASR